jgi:hypothetical protein
MEKVLNDREREERENFRPTPSHKDPEGELRYISTLSLTSALDGSRWTTPHPG